MAAFINNDITAAGLLVLAKGVAGKQINYTKIVLGDGYLEEGQTPRSLTGVVSPKATIDITKCVVNGDGTVTVGGVFTNDQTNDGFYYRELGLYADDPDEDVGEVLYCYGNCGDLAEWIPPTGGATIVEKTIDIVTAIGTATNVTAYIPADAPVVSLSIGDTCTFRFGNPDTRNKPYADVELQSGDLFVFGGPSRFAYHGVPKVFPGTADPDCGLTSGRLNITLRVTGLEGER